MDPLTGLAIGTTVFNAGSALFGKSKQAKQQRKYNRWLDEQQTKLDAWYGKEKNTSYLDTAEGQNIYNGFRKLLKENDMRVDNSLVKTGGSTEAKLASKGKAQETMGNVAAQMSANDTVRKQQLDSQYISQRNHLQELRGGNMQGAITGASNTADNAMGALSGGLQTIFTSQAANKQRANNTNPNNTETLLA